MKNSFKYIFSFLFLLFLLFPVGSVFAQGSTLELPTQFNLEYTIAGDYVVLTEEEFSAKGSIIGTLSIDCTFNSTHIIADCNTLLQIGLIMDTVIESLIIDVDTGSTNTGKYPAWILFTPEKQIKITNNCSQSPISLHKSHIEAIQDYTGQYYIKCQAYTTSFDQITQSLRITYYYDTNTMLLVKYKVEIIKNLVAVSTQEAILVQSSISGFKVIDSFTAFFWNYYLYVIIFIMMLIILAGD